MLSPDFRISARAVVFLAVALAGCIGGPAVRSPYVDSSAPGPAPVLPQLLKPEDGPSTMTASLQSIIHAAKTEASSRLGIPPETIEVLRAESVTWPDGSLGCPEPGMQYTQALVPGYRIILKVEDRQLDYHAAANGHFSLCPPGRAVDPVADDRI